MHELDDQTRRRYGPAAQHQDTTVRLDHPALVVVDVQNAFCHPDGSLARLGAPTEMCRAAVGPVVALVEAARAGGVPIVYTRFVYRPDYADGGILVDELRPHLKTGQALRAGDWDSELVAELTPRPGERVVDKNRYSAFLGTDFEAILREAGVRTLVVCGVTTNLCVETTARDAAQRDYRVYVVREATGEYDPARHAHALESIAFGFGWVVDLEEMVEALSGDVARPSESS